MASGSSEPETWGWGGMEGYMGGYMGGSDPAD